MEILAISNETTLDEGETALLSCLGHGDLDVGISWWFNGARVGNTSLTTVYGEDLVKGGRVFMQSFLELCSVTTSAMGGYTCVISNSRRSVNSTVQLNTNSKRTIKQPCGIYYLIFIQGACIL